MLIPHWTLVRKHAYIRRSEAMLPKLTKCMPTVSPKLMSCAMVQEGACVCLGQSISHLYRSLQCLGTVRWGMLRTMTSIMVLRLRIVTPSRWKRLSFNALSALHLVGRRTLGRNARLQNTIQGWSHPFRYNNIENHLRNQHNCQWALYQALESSYERVAFFNVPVLFKNSIKAHFPSSSVSTEQQIVYNIHKDIVDTIVGDMMFNLEDQDDSDADNDAWGTCMWHCGWG